MCSHGSKKDSDLGGLVSVSGKWKGNKKGTKNKTEVYGYLSLAPRAEPSPQAYWHNILPPRCWLPSNTGDFEYVKWQALTWKIIRTAGSYK